MPPGIAREGYQLRPCLSPGSIPDRGALLEVVATDSYRLGAINVPVADLQATLARPPLVPARTARGQAKQLKKDRGTVRILGSSGNRNGQLAIFTSRLVGRSISHETPARRQTWKEQGLNRRKRLRSPSDKCGRARLALHTRALSAGLRKRFLRGVGP